LSGWDLLVQYACFKLDLENITFFIFVLISMEKYSTKGLSLLELVK
jgi:hypothetical protein